MCKTESTSARQVASACGEANSARPSSTASMPCRARRRHAVCHPKKPRPPVIATLDTLKAKGMQVNEVSPAEQVRMFQKVKPVYDRNVPTIGAEAVNQVLDALKKARGG